MLPTVYSIIQEDGSGETARMFGLGAMAGVMPIVGIPMLIASIFQSSNADEKKAKYAEQFDQMYRKYLEKWDEVQKQGEALYEKQLAYFAPKLTQMYLSAFGRVIEDIGNHGYPIYKAQNYFLEEGD